jgi:hypothetical protein
MIKVMLCWDDASVPGGMAQAHTRFAAVPVPGFEVRIFTSTCVGDAIPKDRARVKSATLFSLHPDDANPLAHAMCEIEWI